MGDVLSSMHERNNEVPRLAATLGYAGLLPFIVLAVAIWLTPTTYTQQIHHAIISYGAVILSFMGAIHWGLAMLHLKGKSRWQLGFSVVPPLLGWWALLLENIWSYSILITSFGILCWVDCQLTWRGLAPRWYPALRTPLTTIVIFSLSFAAIGSFW